MTEITDNTVPEPGQVVVSTQTNTTTNTTPSTRYIETMRAFLVALSLVGSIVLALKYKEALTPALVVLGGAVGGYFGVSSQSTKSGI